jgi:hypothetical protein
MAAATTQTVDLLMPLVDALMRTVELHGDHAAARIAPKTGAVTSGDGDIPSSNDSLPQHTALLPTVASTLSLPATALKTLNSIALRPLDGAMLTAVANSSHEADTALRQLEATLTRLRLNLPEAGSEPFQWRIAFPQAPIERIMSLLDALTVHARGLNHSLRWLSQLELGHSDLVAFDGNHLPSLHRQSLLPLRALLGETTATLVRTAQEVATLLQASALCNKLARPVPALVVGELHAASAAAGSPGRPTVISRFLKVASSQRLSSSSLAAAFANAGDGANSSPSGALGRSASQRSAQHNTHGFNETDTDSADEREPPMLPAMATQGRLHRSAALKMTPAQVAVALLRSHVVNLRAAHDAIALVHRNALAQLVATQRLAHLEVPSNINVLAVNMAVFSVQQMCLVVANVAVEAWRITLPDEDRGQIDHHDTHIEPHWMPSTRSAVSPTVSSVV